MSVPEHDPRYEVRLYIENAQEMLEVAAHNLTGGFYGSAVNRAYYAIFYAANALLRTRDIVRSKHSGVIAAFRQHFVKPRLIEAEYSRIYGRVMENRHVGDYEVAVSVDSETAKKDLRDAQRFVEHVEQFLRRESWL